MQGIIDNISEAICEWLIEGIAFILTGMFSMVNTNVALIGGQVAVTPQDWNSSVFNIIKTLSETVIIPIAAMMLTAIMCYEIITMVIEQNKFHDFPPSEILKWIFKTAISIYILTNSFEIVMAVFDMSQHIVDNSTRLIGSELALSSDELVEEFKASLEDEGVFSLFSIWVQCILIYFGVNIIGICVLIAIYSRMMEIYMTISIAPIPFATFGNKEASSMGQNYMKTIIALGFQAYFMMVCVAIYAGLINDIVLSGNPLHSLYQYFGMTLLLCFMVFKTGSISKGVFGAH